MRFLSTTSLSLAVLAASSFACSHPAAAQTTYQGNDPGVGAGGARPNSDAAAASFGTAAGVLGAKNTINFESAPLGFVTSLGLDANTTLTTTNQDSSLSGISSDSTDKTLGYNTTATGSKYYLFSQNFGSPGTATFTFSTPIDAFGGYLTGAETGIGAPILLQFSDGSSQSLTVSKNPSGGGVQYLGFTDASKSISAVTFAEAASTNGTRDVFGIDDITYVKAATISTVPEPSTPVILGLGSLALAGLALRARKSKASLLS